MAFAIGAFGGLRTGVFALRWLSVDLDSRRIVVRASTRGPVKDREPRVVPILDSLYYDVLEEWRLRNPGPGLVVPLMRKDGKKIDKETPGKFLRKALVDLGLAREDLGWYECTRHIYFTVGDGRDRSESFSGSSATARSRSPRGTRTSPPTSSRPASTSGSRWTCGPERVVGQTKAERLARLPA